ncbi:MAG: hypothetical protein KatS3mg126_2260 [Lysobacteraceae bacterium]|nr:MAG: hypothetical protein KatS3mg126_2260 [Xanthomonadaceae bacterium]
MPAPPCPPAHVASLSRTFMAGPGLAWRAVVVAVLFALAGSACSTRSWYDGGRASLAETCRRQPTEAAYQRCMEDARLDYETYQRRRERIETPDTQRR